MNEQQHNPNDVWAQVTALTPKRRQLLEHLLRQQSSVFKTQQRPISTPLSYPQERVWLADQIDPGNKAYNFPLIVKFTGDFNVCAMQFSMNTLLTRHEILSTVFPTDGLQVLQRVVKLNEIKLPLIDLSTQTLNQEDTDRKRIIQEDANRPFDLASGPLVRVSLYKLANQQHILLFCLHHILCDNWASGILLGELEQLYSAYLRGDRQPRTAAAFQYRDFAIWQRKTFDDEGLKRDLSYWREQLEGAATQINLPNDYPRPDTQSFEGMRAPLHLPSALVEKLRILAVQHDTTPFTVILTAVNTMLYRYTGQNDILIGIDIANRTFQELEKLIGFLANQLVIRSQLGGNPTFAQLLTQVHTNCEQAYSHPDVPFHKLVEALALPWDLSRSPLFQVKVIKLDFPMEKHAFANLTAEPVLYEGSAKFDLEFVVWDDQAGNMNGFIEFATDLFKTNTVADMCVNLTRILESVVVDDDVDILDIALNQADTKKLPAAGRDERQAANKDKFSFE